MGRQLRLNFTAHFNFGFSFGIPQTAAPRTNNTPNNNTPNTESVASSAGSCDSHKKILFKPEALNAFQKAWDDSEYGVQDKQHEEGGVVTGESNPNGDLNLIPKAYPRKPDEPVYRLDNFDTWQPELAKILPQNQKILYFITRMHLSQVPSML